MVSGQVVFCFYCLLLTAHCSLFSRTKAKTTAKISRKRRLRRRQKARLRLPAPSAICKPTAGNFNVQFDSAFAGRSRERAKLAQFAVRIAEKVEGGFGGGEPLPLENANVSANITTADGQAVVANNLPLKIGRTVFITARIRFFKRGKLQNRF